jgi:hypothetical protein
MSEFKKKVQDIIEDYCEGISHLEFSIEKFPEMLEKIENEALRIHDVGETSLNCEKCGGYFVNINHRCFKCLEKLF